MGVAPLAVRITRAGVAPRPKEVDPRRRSVALGQRTSLGDGRTPDCCGPWADLVHGCMAGHRAGRASGPVRASPHPEAWWLPYAVATGFVAVALLVFSPALQGTLLWDDAEILSRNPVVRMPGGLYEMWSRGRAVAQVPLTTTMFWVEWRLWGDQSLGYHVVNVVLHALGAVLTWRVLRRLAVPGALTAAALFLVHPVTVASVAWIAERKNTLSLVLVAGAMLAYLRFEDEEGRWWYALALTGFLLAMLAKPAVVMLPIVLLGAAWVRRDQIARVDLMRVLPFLVLAFVLGMATVYEHPFSATRGADLRPEGMASRVAAVGWVVWFYLGKAIVPLNLAMVYPRWDVDPTHPFAWIPLVALASAFAVAWGYRAGWGRTCVAGLGYVVVVLAPVLGLMEMSFHRHSLVSDHLQYLALPGVLAMVVGVSMRAVQGWTSPKAPPWQGGMLACVACLGLASLTWQRAHVFASSEALWADNAERFPNTWVAHSNLGLALLERGAIERAATHVEQAVRLDPEAPESAINLGRVYEERGMAEAAREQYVRAIRLAPDRAEPRNNLGEVLGRLGDTRGAIEAYEAAIRIQPAFPEAHNNLGVVLAEAGRTAAAEARYREAIRLRPEYAEAHSNLGNLLLQAGRPEEALAEHRAALALRPGSPELQNNLATVLTTQGRHEEASVHYRAVIAARPDLAQPHHNLATSLAGSLAAVDAKPSATTRRPSGWPRREAASRRGLAERANGAMLATAVSLRLAAE